jgi:hypothetical protein
LPPWQRIRLLRASRACVDAHSGITGPNRFSRPRDDSRRFYAARNVAVFRRDSFTRDAKLASRAFLFARSRTDAGATRIELSLGVGLPTRRAFRLEGPSLHTRSDVPCHPDTPLRACTPCGMRCDPGASFSRTAACPSRADLAAVADPMNLPFPPSQDSLRRARFRCSSLAIRNAFDWSSIPVLPGAAAARSTCSANRTAAAAPFHPSQRPAPSRACRAATQG